jgi:hypothetical protein
MSGTDHAAAAVAVHEPRESARLMIADNPGPSSPEDRREGAPAALTCGTRAPRPRTPKTGWLLASSGHDADGEAVS